jgi:hypothetical protein
MSDMSNHPAPSSQTTTEHRVGLKPLAWSLFALGIVLAAAAVMLGVTRGDEGRGLTDFFEDIYWLSNFVLFLPVGALVASKHPANPVGWLVFAVGLSEIVSSFAYEYAAHALVLEPGSLPLGREMAWLSAWIWAPELGLFPFLMLLFPTGRMPPRPWRWVGWIAVAWLAMWFAFAIALWPVRGRRFLIEVETFGVESLDAFENFVFGSFPVVGLCLVISLIYIIVRFFRSRGVERQQLKWVAFAASIAAVYLLVVDILLSPFGLDDGFIQLVGETISGPGLFAVAAAVAMLRYRLYDIDRIINKTLVYGALTSSLALLYVLIVGAASSVVGESALTVAATTLAVAGLFRPLRSRIQQFIDRRFYRQKYDAARTVQAFSTTMRDEVDLTALTQELIAVASKTMQPAHATLWLRTTDGIR